MGNFENGPVALVTGGARGIGLAISSALLEAGYRVAIADLDVLTATEARESLAKHESRIAYIQVDVTSTDSTKLMVDQLINTFGGIDLLVNNAGIARQGPSAMISDSDWDLVLSVHLGGTFRCSRAVYPWLSKSANPSIVNVSSVAARFGLPGRLSYCVSKAGIESMTRTLAVEWAPDGIRVNAVAPGWTRTAIWEDAVKRGVVDEKKLISAVPLQRLAIPAEIASAVIFLSSGDSSFITGQTLVVDGGVTVGLHI